MNNSIKRIDLSNLKKCNQVWDGMPKSEAGRTCLKCNNTIIDFRNLTDAEVAKIHLFSDQKVCGLYKKEQLQKIKREDKNIKNTLLNSLCLGVFSVLSFNNFGQDLKHNQIQTEQIEKKYDTFLSTISKEKSNPLKVIKNDSIYIHGNVVDENKQPLYYAYVMIKGTEMIASSDFEGNYRLNITEDLGTLKKITLSYSYLGYKTIEKEIDLGSVGVDKNTIINVALTEKKETAFAVKQREPFHKRVWIGIKSIFKKKK
ncbi:carboxypeptidase-like regulatory domain-containing protein [uncultured Psychroserpens sp.]|uniref:carboxypeptidase-like regulatory domain-containing protein n=1 Tax=uncultured Psychroserpens sp. TaxID=255436 RepID=UPI002634AE80|nr:carboxypeptidase-like regulatory domain-containing protein [uncultured Psychroserpens sp.]